MADSAAMTLAEQYQRQFAWRAWDQIFAALPALDGQLVLDLGCAIGAQAAELVHRGARVIGFDGNDELLAAARARGLARAEFRQADLRELPELDEPADGLWSSFSAAYFVELPTTLRAWARLLRPGGWIALIEVDDLFGHEPLDAEVAARLRAYADEALALGRYDFHMGHKLASHLRAAGFAVTRHFTVADRELAFDGPATPDVLDAWRSRFDRMTTLRSCSEAFLRALADPQHRARALVHVCIAIRVA